MGWVQVFDSLVQVGCPPELLSWFDESTIDVLYALRTLSANQRKVYSPAQYHMGVETDKLGECNSFHLAVSWEYANNNNNSFLRNEWMRASSPMRYSHLLVGGLCKR